jgi:hypothetical protein
MHKVLIVPILLLLAAGCEGTCETLRRAEVWKQHTFFAPNEPVLMAPTNPCNTGCAPEPDCGGGTAQVIQEPAMTVGSPIMPGPDETISTEETNGVLKQP